MFTYGMNTRTKTSKLWLRHDSRKEAEFHDVNVLHLPRHLRGSKTTNLFELARKLNDLTSEVWITAVQVH